jgi:gas vesicle protein
MSKLRELEEDLIGLTEERYIVGEALSRMYLANASGIFNKEEQHNELVDKIQDVREEIEAHLEQMLSDLEDLEELTQDEFKVIDKTLRNLMSRYERK